MNRGQGGARSRTGRLAPAGRQDLLRQRELELRRSEQVLARRQVHSPIGGVSSSARIIRASMWRMSLCCCASASSTRGYVEAMVL